MKLFDPIQVSTLTLPNRAAVTAMVTRLSGEDAHVSGRVFATLDTLIRRIHIAGAPVLVSDTVGFIRKLPHELVTAFRATLEEVTTADLILLVVDVSEPDYEEKMRVVVDVLQDLGAGDHPCLTIYNKADLVDTPPATRTGEALISAKTGEGIGLLRDLILERISPVPA